MDKEAGPILHASGICFEAREWEEFGPRAILAQIDWKAARIALKWANDHLDLTQTDWSPEYTQDLATLKHVARTAAHPRRWFESYAIHILYSAQVYLVEFLRGKANSPCTRHLIYVWGSVFNPEPVWISHAKTGMDGLAEEGKG